MKMKAEPSYTLEGSSQGIITWCRPLEVRLNLNINGTCHPDEVYNNRFEDWDGDSVDRELGGYEGILRNHNGKWVRGFIGYIGVTASLTTKFHGILKGLEFSEKLCLNGAILETNCQAIFSGSLDEMTFM
nr:hypothetical protein [Tanacetum cinerariifolium]